MGILTGGMLFEFQHITCVGTDLVSLTLECFALTNVSP